MDSNPYSCSSTGKITYKIQEEEHCTWGKKAGRNSCWFHPVVSQAWLSSYQSCWGFRTSSGPLFRMVIEAKITHLLGYLPPPPHIFQHCGPEIKWVDGSKPLLKVSTHLVSTVYTQVCASPLKLAVIALWMSWYNFFSKQKSNWHVLWIYFYSISPLLKKGSTDKVLIGTEINEYK